MKTTFQENLDCAGGKLFTQLVEQQCPSVDAQPLLDFLIDNGLLSYRRCKAFVAFHKVIELVEQGRRITEAMHLVATQMACSYETVRKYYYIYADKLGCRYQQIFNV